MIFSGILFCLLASCLFALLCYYTVFLEPLDGFAVFGWRVFGTVILIAALMTVLRQWRKLGQSLVVFVKRPAQFLVLLVCVGLMSVQVGLFGWAPLNGESQALALGYFLMPLMMVICGRLLFGETLTRWQRTAVILAAIGVGAQIILHGGLSWVSALVMLGYPPYFIIKRHLGLNALHSMLVEHLCMLPLAIALVVAQGGNPEFFVQHGVASWGILIGLGLLGGSALLCFLAGSQRLPLSLFGMLGYVEPLLLFVVALILPGGHFTAIDLATYLPIWVAVCCLLRQGWLAFGAQQASLQEASKS
ncbi:EamA family transporter RarD [Celerinatantimonas sp. MCCC 1A17872]|uniref:EamA family transporter RarD n=1 Tax=Celerinatantimonas sp. MCCC 1A17872 TaxID=3177514 RepID=UPI0038CA3473